MAGRYCGTLGQMTPCANMRRVPARRLTRLRVATIWSSDKSILCGSTEGEVDSSARVVSLSKNMSFR